MVKVKSQMVPDQKKKEKKLKWYCTPGLICIFHAPSAAFSRKKGLLRLQQQPQQA